MKSKKILYREISFLHIKNTQDRKKTIMADRFKDLNINSSSQKKPVNKIENSQRENIFKTTVPDNYNNQKQRSTTGKSLKQLADQSSGRGQSKQNSYIHRERGNNNGKGKMFVKESKYRISENVKREEFNIANVEFPDLVKDIENKEEKAENIYKDKVNKVQVTINKKQERELPKGWIYLSQCKQNSKEKTVHKNKESEISPYYNPAMAKKILEDRLIYREELNRLLGDISPYWNMVYPEDLDDSDNMYEIDEESEDEEDYVEDW